MKLTRTTIQRVEGECSTHEWLKLSKDFGMEWDVRRWHPVDMMRTDTIALDLSRYEFIAERQVEED